MTDKVEFSMDVPENDHRRMLIKAYLSSLKGRLFVGLMLVCLVLLLGLIPLYKDTWFIYTAPVIIFVLLVLIQIPFVAINNTSKSVRAALEHYKNLTYSIDNTAFYLKSEECWNFTKWELFKSIEEDDKYIFLNYKWQKSGVTIFKYLLPADTVDAIRNVLKELPLEYIKK